MKLNSNILVILCQVRKCIFSPQIQMTLWMSVCSAMLVCMMVRHVTFISRTISNTIVKQQYNSALSYMMLTLKTVRVFGHLNTPLCRVLLMMWCNYIHLQNKSFTLSGRTKTCNTHPCDFLLVLQSAHCCTTQSAFSTHGGLHCSLVYTTVVYRYVFDNIKQSIHDHIPSCIN